MAGEEAAMTFFHSFLRAIFAVRHVGVASGMAVAASSARATLHCQYSQKMSASYRGDQH